MEDVFPQVVFSIFGIPVRDTVISTWIMMAIIVAGAVVVRYSFPTALEMLVSFLADMISDAMGRPAAPYLPFLGALAIFIAISNIIGVVPIVTTPTRDINTPAAMAILVFFAVHVFGVREKGLFRYLKDMASPIYLAPLTLPLELFGQVSRTLSLTLRLFGNVISTEMIVAVIFSLVPLIAPLPLIGLSMFTGLLQAYIFTTLATVFIGAGLEANE
jgi:F-type H+-transporting ATPase subunit a